MMDFDALLPIIVFFSTIAIAVVIALLSHYDKVIPDAYVAVPWQNSSISNQIGIRIDNVWVFSLVISVLFLVSIITSVLSRSIVMWQWRVMQSGEVDGFKSSVLVMTMLGEFVHATTGSVTLVFSVISIWYLLAVATGRGVAVIILSQLKNTKKSNTSVEEGHKYAKIKTHD